MSFHTLVGDVVNIFEGVRLSTETLSEECIVFQFISLLHIAVNLLRIDHILIMPNVHLVTFCIE